MIWKRDTDMDFIANNRKGTYRKQPTLDKPR